MMVPPASSDRSAFRLLGWIAETSAGRAGQKRGFHMLREGVGLMVVLGTRCFPTQELTCRSIWYPEVIDFNTVDGQTPALVMLRANDDRRIILTLHSLHPAKAENKNAGVAVAATIETTAATTTTARTTVAAT